MPTILDRMPHPSFTDRLERVVIHSAAGRWLQARRTKLGARRAPLHWTNMFGVIALACVFVLFVTGVILMSAYAPSSGAVTYHGPYVPLAGAEMSKALESTLFISFEMPGGILLRQTHHWAALLLPAAIMLQLVVAFFTGAFRRPRRLSWLLLFGLLIAALLGGWSGYALPDDMLSGTGLRIVEGIMLGIPVIGTWLSRLLFGGEFPGQIIENLYPLHLGAGVLLVVLLIWRWRDAYAHEPAQFPGNDRTVPAWPNFAVRAGGLFAATTGLLFLIGGTVTIAPVWLYGPASPGDASAGSQPDWYTGFLDGALRLVPPGWEFEWLDRTWTLAVIVPLLVVGAFLFLVAVYPFVEEWVSGDSREHHTLDRPRNVPIRTGIGVAGIVFFGVLWGAGGADVIATQLSFPLEGVITTFQVLVPLGPIVAFDVTRRVCVALQKKEREMLLHGYETGRIVRLPGGGYLEVHRELDAQDRDRLVGPAPVEPFVARPDRDGRVHLVSRVRARASRFFHQDRLTPLGGQSRPALRAGEQSR
ncbi:cytochrome b [Microbacterium immunditiarum]|uniref:Cytochrome bc1 complex cytochrome b subunit n=1 Tax=Microbacterium immunditiarum TaxID=337480 RepID=A0A7Y9KK92_9MICO|nr:cytochrome b N-terminal domain-containing protein [Microbacterium immunditiarum]NYE18983.1 ubiquinol-cytochrome c reductase cytochrome b subunit [Microbacterium immunditiarum]